MEERRAGDLVENADGEAAEAPPAAGLVDGEAEELEGLAEAAAPVEGLLGHRHRLRRLLPAPQLLHLGDGPAREEVDAHPESLLGLARLQQAQHQLRRRRPAQLHRARTLPLQRLLPMEVRLFMEEEKKDRTGCRPGA